MRLIAQLPATAEAVAVDADRTREWELWLEAGVELLVAAAIGIVVHVVLARVVRRLASRRPDGLLEIAAARLRRPGRFAWPLLFMLLARSRRMARVEPPLLALLDHLLLLGLIAALTWALVELIGAIETYVKRRHSITEADNREARRVHTQVTVLGRSLQVVTVVAGVALALMTFPRVQQIGASLLASAGIAGIIVGLAARPVLENLIAGLQLGFTQPLRLDDVVVMGGEFGRVEDITTTYVVLRLWDERRLIVPFSKIIDEPFQNWTRTTSQILGTVFVWVDYASPIETVRVAARRIVEDAPQWDRRVFTLQVTDATEQAVQLRVVVSAASAGDAWELRVHVREKLIEFLQRELPQSLPARRVQLRQQPPTEG